MSKKALTETLQTIQDETEGDEISFADIVEALNHRGFGALLTAPALIAVLPTGAIPGVPFLCAVFITLVAAQIAIGRRYPWIPKRLQDVSFSRKKYKSAVKKAKVYTEWIDGFFHERLSFLTNDIAQRLIAVLCIFLALSIIPIGFIPFAAALPSITILIFGLSLSVRDGLLALIGFLVMAVTVAAIPYLMDLI
ncbi:MAG: exopolysaccharide biosynthesis protein [Alphaproteobacteria bacterium]|nr:exopolysaccharide biosynthesis protein [Alphaproteobacteria bacterium]